MAESPRLQLTLRAWDDCTPATQKRVLAWTDHPDVPEHARTMVPATIARQHHLRSNPTDDLSIHIWIAVDGHRPAAFLTADIRSEWTRPDEFRASELYVGFAGPTMSFSTLIDPELWGPGHSTAAKLAAIDQPVAANVRNFHAEVRADNERSLTAMAKFPGVRMIGTSVADGHQWLHFHWQRTAPSPITSP
ncbi:hypothetical protein ACFYV7_40470 [Nocardia suismassiliense]|uniref:Lysine N-acyltransferase MbtK n=1 Tax=Nocardia suismassiliense TaxID=2077092 RepID=A0ABW6R6G3_9NOCA